jgi:hypothetical protein
MHAIQIIAALLGILGAVLITSRRSEIRFVAFMVWIFSNLLLGMVYVNAEMWSLLAMIAVYTGTSVYGAWNTRIIPEEIPVQPLKQDPVSFSAEQTRNLVDQLMLERAKSSRLQDDLERIQTVLEAKFDPRTRCYVLHEQEATLLNLKLV